jgi:hypothetical protein
LVAVTPSAEVDWTGPYRFGAAVAGAEGLLLFLVHALNLAPIGSRATLAATVIAFGAVAAAGAGLQGNERRASRILLASASAGALLPVGLLSLPFTAPVLVAGMLSSFGALLDAEGTSLPQRLPAFVLFVAVATAALFAITR